MREPEFGYWDVTCSRVTALEQHPPKMSESVENHMVEARVRIRRAKSQAQARLKYGPPLLASYYVYFLEIGRAHV